MARIDPIPFDRMTVEQRLINDEISSIRSHGPAAGGPFGLWLRTPELADRANKFGTFVRTETTVPRRLSELAIMIIARHWTAHYEWSAHEGHVLKAGLERNILEEIRERRRPEFSNQDEALVYDLTLELQIDRALSDATYARAVEMLGEQTVLDLVTIIGFYTMLAIVLAAFRVDIPDGGTPPLPE